VTTVSHAFSGHGRVAAATRDRVLRIADDLGYTANVHAQRLVWGRSRTLAIQIAGFTTASSKSLLLPDAAYFMDVLNGAASAAAEQQYALMLTPHALDPNQIHPLAIDGGVIVDPAGDEALATVLSKREKPIVTTGRPTRGSAFPWVDNDHGQITRRMLTHMLAMGHARPALIATTPTRSYVADIVEAYEAWTREHDLPQIIVELREPPTERAAARAASRLLTRSDRPDAVYATYDRLALGVLSEARRLRISVPDELGIASAVDSDALRWADPHITAAGLNARRIGREAVRLLIDLLEGREPVSRRVVVPSRVIPRSSTRRARAEETRAIAGARDERASAANGGGRRPGART
jgi:DNA-binding LacI/PurR family transcriptional regulator